MSKKATSVKNTDTSVKNNIEKCPSGSISSPPSKISNITKFLSPRKDKKPKKSKSKTKKVERSEATVEDEKRKQDTSTSEKGKKSSPESDVQKSNTQMQDRDISISLGQSSKDKDERVMVQTSLSMTKTGVEVISSPEQQQTENKKEKQKSSRQQKSGEKVRKQTRITNIFPVRKSNRKTKSQQEKDEQKRITDAILSKKYEGLEVRTIEGKGRGVFTSRDFERNEFVCEYSGELINLNEAKKREKQYGKDSNIGCYMYYLECNNKKYCVDATAEDNTLGRLLNHSRSGNCKTKVHLIDDTPHLIFVTTNDVKTGEELTYDYGDRSKDAIESHPWLKY